ncbi:PadR family transcriptional regulator [Micromonospora sp. CA-111912]|uniref:PadR family transcriptional regulator n=1 Tax=Micromonospora sp. CA-111912 TaxID=3239955 RepID=UPI003D90FEE7
MSATRMMILGLVKWMQPVHGYDVRRELLSWGADKWANVQPGSIYHALRKLAQDGLLREVATEQVGARPARTTYEITPRGLGEFETLLRDLWWGTQQPADPFVAAFAFLPALPRPEAVAALRSRGQVIRAGVESMRASMESSWIRDSKPVGVAWTYELWIARGEAEADWCDRVADRIEAGAPYLPEGLAGRDGRIAVEPAAALAPTQESEPEPESPPRVGGNA